MPASLVLRKWFTLDLEIFVAGIFTFISFILTAKIGQYIFFTEHSAPALIWAPIGISIAAVYLWGYRMWVPIFLAQLLIAPVAFANSPPFVNFISACAYALQAVIGAYGLRGLGFTGKFEVSKDAFLIIGASVMATVIAPTILVFVKVAAHIIPFTAAVMWTYWSRVWAAGMFSVLIMVPLLTTLYLNRPVVKVPKDSIEMGAAFGILILGAYLIFWTTLSEGFAFPLIYLLCGVLFWLSLRFGPRTIAVGLFVLSVMGIAGSLIGHPTATPINYQLFADELFITLLAPIFLIFVSVIEERRKASQALASNVAELEDALARLSAEDQSKNEFIAILAHELRNPLAPVMSTFELLSEEEALPEDVKQMITSAQQQMVAMRRLLDDLLDVARVTQREFKLQKEEVDLLSIVTQSVDHTRFLIAERGHIISVSLPPATITMYADPIRIEQIIVNLINNAAKYTYPGGNITVSCGIADDCAVISVKDNGVGIPEIDLEKIFQPFRQLPTTGRLGSGLGVGLALTKRLVEMHHGSIYAKSAGKGKGSEFIVRLPLVEAPVVKKKTKETPKAQGSFGSRKNNNGLVPSYRVLVVDDNKPAAEGLGKLLVRQGHETHLVHCGEDALEAAHTFDPHVVLLDIGLPDITGYEVAEKLRSRKDKNYRLIAVTGFGQDEDKRKAADAGFDHHLTKPISIKDVENVLRV